MEAADFGTQKKYPGWGSKKIFVRLGRIYAGEKIPSRATISRILKQSGLVKAQSRARRKSGPEREDHRRVEAVWCNDVWGVDFKGWFCTGDGSKCYPLTISDLYSRFIICCDDLPSMTLAAVWQSFERTFKEYGLPRAIRVDNGKPFGGGWVLGLTQLSVWWRLLGIQVDFIDPGKPYQNAAHERMHLSLKTEIANPPATSLKVQRRRTKTWVKIFNEERPHEALGMKAPAELYVVSELKYQPVKAPEYGSEFEVRRVNSKGDIQWLNHRRFIGEAFQGQRLGLRRWNDAIHEVYLCDILLGHLPDAQFFAFRPTVSRRKTARTVPAESAK
jgi:transposase InsO family protein